MSASPTRLDLEVAAGWQVVAAVNDVAFAEYMSGLRDPAHLRRLLAFQHAHRPGASGALLPRHHAKTTAAIHLVARLIGERQGQVKVLLATATEPDALERSRTIRRLVASRRFGEVFPWARDGVAGETWTERAWTVRGAEAYVEKDTTLRAGSLLSLKPGSDGHSSSNKPARTGRPTQAGSSSPPARATACSRSR